MVKQPASVGGKMMPHGTKTNLPGMCGCRAHSYTRHASWPCETCQESICFWSQRKHMLRHKYPNAPELVKLQFGNLHLEVPALARIIEVIIPHTRADSIFSLDPKANTVHAIKPNEPAIAYADMILLECKEDR